MLEIDGLAVGFIVLPADDFGFRELVAIEFEHNAVFMDHGKGSAFIFDRWRGQKRGFAQMGVKAFHSGT